MLFDGLKKRLKDLKFWGVVLSLAAAFFVPVLNGDESLMSALGQFIPAALAALFGLAAPQSKSLLNPSPRD